LDEQLKATAIEYGEEARKLAEKEAVANILKARKAKAKK
jgi:hypothetical protein